ncbi:hypothetical protein MTO96_045764 [Rhipicephalus appendiculatus]
MGVRHECRHGVLLLVNGGAYPRRLRKRQLVRSDPQDSSLTMAAGRSVLTPRLETKQKGPLEVPIEQTPSGDMDSNMDTQSWVVFTEFELDDSRPPKE